MTLQQILRDNWKHMRVPFQMTLAPIFLWGSFLAHERPDARFLPAFLAFHLLLYTGITAYNSCCDRDEGPIGGLESPPALHPSLLPLSLVLQAVGLPLAAVSGAPVAALYAAYAVLGFLYSHPSTRWKARPALSAAVVFFGQGGMGFLAGWAAARGEVASAWGETGLLGLLTAGLTVLGMYPLTQVYQVEEDARRGDRTLCVALGAQDGLRIAQGAFALAGICAMTLMARRYTAADAMMLAAAYAGLIAQVERFRREYASLTGSEAFRWIMRLSYAASAAFSLFIIARMARWS